MRIVFLNPKIAGEGAYLSSRTPLYIIYFKFIIKYIIGEGVKIPKSLKTLGYRRINSLILTTFCGFKATFYVFFCLKKVFSSLKFQWFDKVIGRNGIKATSCVIKTTSYGMRRWDLIFSLAY